MKLAGAALRVITGCAVVTVASGVNAPCPAGTRVYSLDVWSGDWVDGLVMRCTGDSKDQPIPPGFNDNPGGVEKEGICAGTGGVQSVEWGVPDSFGFIMVYFKITCLDNDTYHFANGKSYDVWNITSNQTVSCKDGEYVQGIKYNLFFQEESSFPYFLKTIDFMCSSSTLDPICADCSGDTAIKTEEDQPEYCELPTCSEVECCESNGGKESESITTAVIIGVVSTVVATMIISAGVSTFKAIKKRTATARGVEGFHMDDASSLENPAVWSSKTGQPTV